MVYRHGFLVAAASSLLLFAGNCIDVGPRQSTCEKGSGCAIDLSGQSLLQHATSKSAIAQEPPEAAPAVVDALETVVDTARAVAKDPRKTEVVGKDMAKELDRDLSKIASVVEDSPKVLEAEENLKKQIEKAPVNPLKRKGAAVEEALEKVVDAALAVAEDERKRGVVLQKGKGMAKLLEGGLSKIASIVNNSNKVRMAGEELQRALEMVNKTGVEFESQSPDLKKAEAAAIGAWMNATTVAESVMQDSAVQTNGSNFEEAVEAGLTNLAVAAEKPNVTDAVQGVLKAFIVKAIDPEADVSEALSKIAAVAQDNPELVSSFEEIMKGLADTVAAVEAVAKNKTVAKAIKGAGKGLEKAAFAAKNAGKLAAKDPKIEKAGMALEEAMQNFENALEEVAEGPEVGKTVDGMVRDAEEIIVSGIAKLNDTKTMEALEAINAAAE